LLLGERPPLVIFDLDGTLADASHRRHLVGDGLRKDWDAFYDACDADRPKWPIIAMACMLREQGAELWLWSGRSDRVRQKTEAWLQLYDLRGHFTDIRMRPDGDYTPDDALKMGWFSKLRWEDRYRLLAVFDDRDRMVRAWRDRGVTCLQVADGNF
jgi:beta-phosphoglucomutase-like phosphatase (HAD superfamily)